MTSLTQPVGRDGSKTLIDVIKVEPVEDDLVKQRVALVMDAIRSLENQKQRWLLRLSIIVELPLKDYELDALAQFSRNSRSIIATRIAEITQKLSEKALERSEMVGKAVLYWHEISRLEKKLEKMELDVGCNRSEIEALQVKIQHKQESRNDLLTTGRKTPRPSDRELAELIGIPVTDVGKNLERARTTVSLKARGTADDE